jgi:UDP-glucose 4-epimerase
MKNHIVITGGAGFVGSNLIEHLIKKTKYKIVSLDNYSSGSRKNHIKNSRVKYLKGNTKDIFKLLNSKKKKFILFFTLVNLLEYIKAF